MPKPSDNQAVLAWAQSHAKCCSVVRFTEGGCKVALPERSNARPGVDWICLSGTKYQHAHSHDSALCDLLFVHQADSPDRPVLVASELKGGRVDVSEVVAQLQGAAKIVECVAVSAAHLDFIPVLFRRGVSTVMVNRLRAERIRFHGERHKISLARCGTAIASIRP